MPAQDPAEAGLRAAETANVVAAVSTANAATQTGSYVQADVQSIAALANANKTAINAILTALKNAGLMESA